MSVDTLIEQSVNIHFSANQLPLRKILLLKKTSPHKFYTFASAVHTASQLARYS